MLSRYNPIDIEAALRSTPAAAPFPPASDRAAWAAARAAIGEARAAAIIAQAETDARSPFPPLPASLFLEFLRTGERDTYQTPYFRRSQVIASLTLAECLEGRGRFLDAIMDVTWARCEESSWAMPAHQQTLTDMARPHIDLGVAMVALQLAELDALLGSQLDPLVSQRIRYELDRRCFTPYLERHDHWWLFASQTREVNNWTAVCNAGVVGAAIYAEPNPARLAEMIARAARSLDDYLATFDRDGGSTEGPGYWSYGFGYYTILGQLVEQRTAGKIAFMGEEIVRKAAQFPLRTSLGAGVYANFSDCDRDIQFIPAQLAYLARRLDLPDLARLAHTQAAQGRRSGELTWALRDLFWRPDPAITGEFIAARRDWFEEMMWMFARMDPANPAALALAAKGGHNEEMHNQNDVGSFIVHFGGETLIPDVGRGRYTKAYFGPQRYAHFVNASRGHSVPRPNGCEQLPGRQYAAALLEHSVSESADRLVLELKGAYPAEARLQSLRRSITLHRETPQGWVELCDEVCFAGGPGQCQSVLTTFSAVTLEAGCVLIRGERAALIVRYDQSLLSARVEVERQVDLALGPADVNCLVFEFLQPVAAGTLRLVIEPAVL